MDEAHRGYTLDQEMTEGELALRDPAQYLSTYRRVLDYLTPSKSVNRRFPRATPPKSWQAGIHLLLPRSRGRRRSQWI